MGKRELGSEENQERGNYGKKRDKKKKEKERTCNFFLRQLISTRTVNKKRTVKT